MIEDWANEIQLECTWRARSSSLWTPFLQLASVLLPWAVCHSSDGFSEGTQAVFPVLGRERRRSPLVLCLAAFWLVCELVMWPRKWIKRVFMTYLHMGACWKPPHTCETFFFSLSHFLIFMTIFLFCVTVAVMQTQLRETQAEEPFTQAPSVTVASSVWTPCGVYLAAAQTPFNLNISLESLASDGMTRPNKHTKQTAFLN